MELFYTDIFVLPLPSGHRFPMDKYRLLRERVSKSLLSETCHLRIPPPATDDQLRLAHAPDYIARVSEGRLTLLEERRIGFPWSPQMVDRSRRSTGASIAAAQSAIKNQVSVNLAGGTHHASTNCGSGYCVFNDSCVAARVLQQAGLCRNVLILDLDVHQGNGTAEICQDDASIFTCSIHCEKNYPFVKAQSDLDIAMPEGTADDQYSTTLAETFQAIERRFVPDFVFYLAGADPYHGDRLGKMKLTKHGLLARDEAVFSWCHRHQLPVAVSMAGGYAPNVNDIVDIHFNTVAAAAKYSL